MNRQGRVPLTLRRLLVGVTSLCVSLAAVGALWPTDVFDLLEKFPLEPGLGLNRLLFEIGILPLLGLFSFGLYLIGLVNLRDGTVLISTWTFVAAGLGLAIGTFVAPDGAFHYCSFVLLSSCLASTAEAMIVHRTGRAAFLVAAQWAWLAAMFGVAVGVHFMPDP